MECYGLSLRIPAYNGITHYFIALCGHKQFNVMPGTLVIIFDFIPDGFSFSISFCDCIERLHLECEIERTFQIELTIFIGEESCCQDSLGSGPVRVLVGNYGFNVFRCVL